VALADAARRAGVRRFVFVSSNAAGGRCRSADEILDESMPARPASHYGKSKLEAEQALLAFHAPDRFEIVILRPSMFYGPPVPDRHVDIYRRVAAGTMPLVGGGDFRRSATHIDNLVEAVRLALVKPEASGQIYYVVDRNIYTTRRITESMAQALGVSPRFVRLPRLVGPIAAFLDELFDRISVYSAPMHLLGESHWHVAISSEKAARELGYSGAAQLQQGMDAAVAWCRERGLL
jgi:nucleoside-diphosphate-sugar epimerase